MNLNKCPKCDSELETVYSPHGIYEKCPQCGYEHDELSALLKETSFEPDYKTPVDRLSASQRRHYMLSVSVVLKMMTIIEVILIIFTLISLTLAPASVVYSLLALVIIIAFYLLHGYLKIRHRLGLDEEEQEDIIVAMLNQEYQLKQLRETRKTSLGVLFGYLKYMRTLKKKGDPFRFQSDPLFHDRVMAKVRRETDMNRRITIQNYKNEIAAHAVKREKKLADLEASMYQNYGYGVLISFKLGQVIINKNKYSFDDVLKASMTNHVYDDEEEEVIREGYFKAPTDYDVRPNNNEEVPKHDKIVYDEADGHYKHYAFVEPETKIIKVKRCDAMNIIVETRSGKENIPIIDTVMDVKTPEYVAKQNDCYNVTGGLRRVCRASNPQSVPDLSQDPQVLSENEAMAQAQTKLIAYLKTPVEYVVPKQYREENA